MPCYSPLKGWRDAETNQLIFKAVPGAREAEVACGSCLGCRLDRSRDWAIRIVHESQLHELGNGNSFVTLTYRDPIDCDQEQLNKGLHIPDDWSLHKEHFQKFMKRLRFFLRRKRSVFFIAASTVTDASMVKSWILTLANVVLLGALTITLFYLIALFRIVFSTGV